MAKITAGPLAGEISGKLGTVVFGRGRYGPYLRSRVMPTNRQSTATLDVRSRLSTLSKAWGAVIQINRDAWKTWAATNPIVDRLGNSRTLQPSAAFIQINTRLIQAGGTQIDIPPVVACPAAISGFSAVCYVNTQALTLSWTSGALPANCCLATWVAAVDETGRAYYTNLLKLIDISAAAQATGLIVGAEFMARFGVMIAGQKLFIECEVWDKTTGLISGKACTNLTVLAVAP